MLASSCIGYVAEASKVLLREERERSFEENSPLFVKVVSVAATGTAIVAVATNAKHVWAVVGMQLPKTLNRLGKGPAIRVQLARLCLKDQLLVLTLAGCPAYAAVRGAS